MKLEGRLVGLWVEECRQAWLDLDSRLASRKLAIDLRGVTFIDASGTDLLSEIYRATRADMYTDLPLTRHFAEQAMQRIKTNGKKGV